MSWSTIPDTALIAVVPSSSDSSDSQYDVIYTIESKASSSDTKVSPFTLQIVKESNLPAAFINRHELPNNSLWKKILTDRRYETNFHVIVSTGSGTGLAVAVWESVVKPLLEYFKVKPELHITNDDRSVTELGQNVFFPRANEGMEQHIILLSGDGGIVDLVNSLQSAVSARSDRYRSPSVSLLPLGTGNALAHSANVAGGQTLGLASLVRGSPKPIPLFQARFSKGARVLINEGREERLLDAVDAESHPTALGAVVFSWGFHATLVGDSDTAEYRKFGAERFQMAAKEALYPSDGSPPHAYKGKVSFIRPTASESKPIDRHEHSYILATFCSNLEATFKISPDSKPLDGKLRLVHMGPLGPETMMGIMQKAYDQGRHVEDVNVGYEEVTGLKIEFDEADGTWRRVCIDGTIIRVEQGGWVEIEKSPHSVLDLLVRES